MSILSVDNISPIGSGTSVTVNSAATLVLNNANSTGVITATSFVGGLPITNGADNRVITASSASALNGESQLLFTGTNLGVGDRTTSPDEKLHVHTGSGEVTVHVEGATHANLNLRSHSGDSTIKFSDASATNVGNINYDHGTDSLAFRTNSSERVRIASDGKVGIGLNNPTSLLHLSGSAPRITLTDTAGTDDYAKIFSTGGSLYFQQRDSSAHGNIIFRTEDNSGAIERLRIDSSGNVNIATGALTKPNHPVFIAYRVSNYSLTTSPTELVYDSEKLDVGGNYNPSNGRFTAPVTGLYEFAYASIANNTNTVYRYALRINGSEPYSPMTLELRIHQASSEYGTNGEYVCYVNMTAGQYASVYAKSDTNVSNTYGSSNYGYTYFRGRLIG